MRGRYVLLLSIACMIAAACGGPMPPECQRSIVMRHYRTEQALLRTAAARHLDGARRWNPERYSAVLREYEERADSLVAWRDIAMRRAAREDSMMARLVVPSRCEMRYNTWPA